MIISRESRKSRKIIHRYRSYVAVRMANASEMMRFRVICEIRVRQKSCVKREYFYNAYSLFVTAFECVCWRTYARLYVSVYAYARVIPRVLSPTDSFKHE